MRFRTKKGFTIASALVGAALMGIVSIGIYSLIKSGMDGMMNARSGLERNAILQSLELVINHPEVCKDAFYSGMNAGDHSSYSPPSPPANPATYLVPITRVRMGDSDLIVRGDENEKIKIIDLHFQGTGVDSTPLNIAGQPHQKHFVDVVITTEKTVDGGAKLKKTTSYPVVLYTRDADGRIDQCSLANLTTAAGPERVLGVDWLGAGASLEPVGQPDRLQADIVDPTWSRIQISGSWNSGDVGAVSGVVAKNSSGGISVAFSGATGRVNTGTLAGAAPFCLKISGADVLCARRNGSGIRLTATTAVTAFYTVFVL